jgi:hypothetical protein
MNTAPRTELSAKRALRLDALGSFGRAPTRDVLAVQPKQVVGRVWWIVNQPFRAVHGGEAVQIGVLDNLDARFFGEVL